MYNESMKYAKWVSSLFFVLGTFSIDAWAESTCPTLSLPPEWTLEKNEIHIQDQRWYVFQFWTNVHKTSGGTLPMNNVASELLSAKKIELIDHLDLEGRTCRYNVTNKNNESAQLVIKRIGN